MKPGPRKIINRNVIGKPCLNCGASIDNKLLLFPSTWEGVKFCSKQCRIEGRKLTVVSDETRRKMSVAHIGNKSNKGQKLSIEHIKNVTKALPRGENHWNWKGGITPENHAIRTSLTYKEWRKAVFERDGFKCKIANGDCVHEVHAHHILRFSEYPELRFDVNNGITLCKNHHPLKRSHEQELAPQFFELINVGNNRGN